MVHMAVGESLVVSPYLLVLTACWLFLGEKAPFPGRWSGAGRCLLTESNTHGRPGPGWAMGSAAELFTFWWQAEHVSLVGLAWLTAAWPCVCR